MTWFFRRCRRSPWSRRARPPGSRRQPPRDRYTCTRPPARRWPRSHLRCSTARGKVGGDRGQEFVPTIISAMNHLRQQDKLIGACFFAAFLARRRRAGGHRREGDHEQSRRGNPGVITVSMGTSHVEILIVSWVSRPAGGQGTPAPGSHGNAIEIPLFGAAHIIILSAHDAPAAGGRLPFRGGELHSMTIGPL